MSLSGEGHLSIGEAQRVFFERALQELNSSEDLQALVALVREHVETLEDIPVRTGEAHSELPAFEQHARGTVNPPAAQASATGGWVFGPGVVAGHAVDVTPAAARLWDDIRPRTPEQMVNYVKVWQPYFHGVLLLLVVLAHSDAPDEMRRLLSAALSRLLEE